MVFNGMVSAARDAVWFFFADQQAILVGAVVELSAVQTLQWSHVRLNFAVLAA